MTFGDPTSAVAVYCASSFGNNAAYQNAAMSLGRALGDAGRPLVYGGGSSGLMGLVSGGVLQRGGRVTGVVPYAMVAAGGEKEQAKGTALRYDRVVLDERGRESVKSIIVNSMHERKMEMAKRSCAFIGLPGGYGTFEEVLEVATWSQLGIHNKPIILLNVLGYWEPLRLLIRSGIREGFIPAKNERLVCFVDGPDDQEDHGSYDWGKAALEALERWGAIAVPYPYDWTNRLSVDAPNGEEITAC